ncbi:MAG TPA: hypothetical protein VKE70_23955 [Candidatus Solibacter sp.]|nr:hypothetical protein [Candidatus Solibacter sp.]
MVFSAIYILHAAPAGHRVQGNFADDSFLRLKRVAVNDKPRRCFLLSEIRYALARIADLHFGINKDEAILQVARKFEFSSTSGQLRERVAEQLRQMIDSGDLRVDIGTLLTGSN